MIGCRAERRGTVVHPSLSTLGGAAGGATLGGGAVGVAVGGVVLDFMVDALSACALVEWSSAQRASMAASWS